MARDAVKSETVSAAEIPYAAYSAGFYSLFSSPTIAKWFVSHVKQPPCSGKPLSVTREYAARVKGNRYVFAGISSQRRSLKTSQKIFVRLPDPLLFQGNYDGSHGAVTKTAGRGHGLRRALGKISLISLSPDTGWKPDLCSWIDRHPDEHLAGEITPRRVQLKGVGHDPRNSAIARGHVQEIG